MKATSATWPMKRSLQWSLGSCSPSWKRPLLPSNSLLLNLSWDSRSPCCPVTMPQWREPWEWCLAGNRMLCRWCWARHASTGLSEVFWVTLAQHESSCFQQVEGPQPMAAALQGNSATGHCVGSQPLLDRNHCPAWACTDIIITELPISSAHGVGLTR